ncbi:hypothetical protein [Amycolatopsis anabasis]|uniref:hypothetical protein n=1 Tax=Amycolatopsis anabasis TaxID=1840409 RepID=UPI0015D1AE7B
MESVTVTGGAGVIDLRGEDTPHGFTESLLYSGGAVAALDGPATGGHRLVARAPGRRPELGGGLRIALATGQVSRPLRDSLRPLLDLLADGHYELSGPERLFADEPAPVAWSVPEVGPDRPELVGDGRYLVPTDTWPPAEDDRVAYYRQAIRSGHRPATVLLGVAGGAGAGFVLDGHHKLAAYLAEGVTPQVVRIARTETPVLAAAELRACLSATALGHPALASLLTTLDGHPGSRPEVS